MKRKWSRKWPLAGIDERQSRAKTIRQNTAKLQPIAESLEDGAMVE